LTLSICLSLGLGLTACGDDSSPGGGGETDTDPGTSSETADPTTDTPTTTDNPTTTDTPTTTDPTTDPDTGSGTTDPTDTDPTGDTETTGVVPMDADYRVNSLGILDPPLTYIVSINETAGNLLTESLTTDADEDGDLDLGFVLQFRPLDQSDGASEAFGFANATCTAPQETATCDVLPKTMVSESTYTSSADECYAADPQNLSGATVPPTTGPCFVAEYDAVTIVAGLFALPMQDVQVAATYVGDPAGNLINGNIQGFVSTADADAVMVETDLFTGPLSDLLNDADQDGDGWVFHLSFTAVPTEWTGA